MNAVATTEVEATAVPAPAAPTTASGDSRRAGLLAAFTVAVAVSPIVVGMFALVGETWYPVGDLASALFRISQVGTRATPLVGQESVKGWAHPGPWLFWVSAPLYRLTGGDPRSMQWTAGALNLVAFSGVGVVAWRRGRWPLLVGSMLFVGVLVHTFGPGRIVNLWVPFLPFCSFVLAVFLAWDVAQGHRKTLVPFALAAGFAASTHLAYLTLVGLLVVWLIGWSLFWRRLVPGVDDDAKADPDANTSLPGPPWGPWWASLRRVGIVVAVLGIGPFFDFFFDLHNGWNIVKSVATPPDTVGPQTAIGIVGRYVRPDGPWIGGAEPVLEDSVRGSGLLPLLLAVAVVIACLIVARRRKLVDVAALASLSLVLVIGAIPATSQIFLPAYLYLTQFLKITGALVWFTAAWTVWRLAEPALRQAASRTRARQRLALASGLAAVVATAAWTWGSAADLDTPNPPDERAVQDLRHQLYAVLDKDDVIRVEYVGDPYNNLGPGVIYYLIEDGYQVLTRDGGHGLKWGHEHRLQRGKEPYDVLITVAVSPGGPYYAGYDDCLDNPAAQQLAFHDQLSADERAWLDEMLDRPDDAPPLTDQQVEQLAKLWLTGTRVGVFEGPWQCAFPPKPTS